MRSLHVSLVLAVAFVVSGSSCQKEPEPLPKPIINAVSPTLGDVGGGQTVTIRGQQLQGATGVMFGSAPASGLMVTADGSAVTCLTPPNMRGTVAVSVTTAGGTATSPGAFQYVTQVVVNQLDPNRVPANQAANVTLRGRGLLPPLTVRLNGPNDSVVDATAGAGTDLAVPVAVPALQEGSWTVVVTNGENQVGTATEVLTVTKPIRVTLVDPEAGFADEATPVRMEGTGFEGVTQVLFGTAPCTDLLVEDDTRISCTVPAGVAGPVEVVVRRSPGDETRVANGFTYYAPTDATVRVLYTNPRVGPAPGGTITEIAATGINGQMPTVTIGGAAATVQQVINGKRVRVQIPPHTVTPAEVSKTVQVSITVNGQTDTRQNAFTYYLKPFIASLNPIKGATVGGDEVTIIGEGYTTRDLRVTFGGVAATDVRRLAPTRLSCRAPPRTQGFVDVVVLSEFDRSETAVRAFEYVEAVRVTELDPPTVSLAGGTLVEARGSGFVPGRMEVRLDGTVDIPNPQVIANNRMRFVMPRREMAGTAQLAIRDTNGLDPVLSVGTISVEYQNKTVFGGGVGGGVITRNISVSVVRQDTGQPISGAEVFVGNAWNTAMFRGSTDDRGMVVLAHPNLLGPIMLTAARSGYENQTRVAVDSGEVTFALLPHDPQQGGTPTPAQLTGTVGNWAAAGYPGGVAPGQVKRVAVVWISEPDQGLGSPNPGQFNVVAEEPCDVTPDGVNNPLPTSFTLDAPPGGRVALLAAVYFYDSRNGLCEPGSPQMPSQEGEGFVPLTAGAMGILTDVQVIPGTNPGKNIIINRTVTDGMRVNLVGAPSLGGVGQTGRTVDAILDVGASGIFTFFNPLNDTATFQFNQSLPAAGFSVYGGGDFMNIIPTAVPAPAGDLKYILHGITGRPVIENNVMVGIGQPQTEVWKRQVTAAEENLENWYQFPSGMNPAVNGTLNNRTFRWTAMSQAASFTTVDIAAIDLQGNAIPVWSILLPGNATELVLPNVDGAPNVDDLDDANNLWQLGAYKIFDADGFDYNNHQNVRLGEPYWQARVVSDAVNFTLP